MSSNLIWKHERVNNLQLLFWIIASSAPVGYLRDMMRELCYGGSAKAQVQANDGRRPDVKFNWNVQIKTIQQDSRLAFFTA